MNPGLLAGMLALGVAAAPVEKDGTWIEVSSVDFVVLTDGGASAARRTILRFETIRAALAAVMPSVRLSGERELVVIAPRGEKSLRSLIPGWWAAKDGMAPSTVHLSDRNHTFLLVRTDLREEDDQSFDAAHWGFTSHLVSLNTPRLPPWASRGLAGFYAPTTVQKNRVRVGRAPASHVRALREGVLMPVTDLWAVDHESLEYLDRDRLGYFDAESWALVHYLMLDDEGAHRENLARFLVLLNEDRRPNDAAREALGDPRALDKALASYIRKQALYARATSTAVDVRLETAPERPLSSAEALTMRAAVHLASERYPDAHACLDEALRLDPRLAWAHETRAALAWEEDDPAAAREAVARALSLEPGRPLATRLQKRVSGPPTVEGAERLCDGGDLAACAQLGGWLIDGSGTPPDPPRGVELMERACGGGDAQACRHLSWRYRQGTGVPADGARAVAFLEKGCAAGDSKACLAAASDHQASHGVPADTAGTARMLEAACTQGERTACAALAWALQNGEGIPRDLERAAALYQDGCHAGDAASCTRLGILYARPGGLPTDHARAKQLLTKACELGDRAGCSNLEMLAALTESATK